MANTINNFVVNKDTETTVKVSFQTSGNVTKLWYSTNAGYNYTQITPSTNFTIGHLAPNTTYRFRIKVEFDNFLPLESSVYTQSTYAYPHILSVKENNLLIGSEQEITLYNPIPRSLDFEMRKDNPSGTVLYETTITDTVVKFTPDTNILYNSIPNSQTGNCVYFIYGTGSSTGQDSSDVLAYSVLGTEKPIFENFTYRDKTYSSITGNDQVLVKGKSVLEVTIPAANKMVAQNGSSENNYNITCDTKSVIEEYSTQDIVSEIGTIDNAGTLGLTVTAYDSRGLGTPIYKPVEVYDYSKPTINLRAERLNHFEDQTTIEVSGSLTKLTIDNVNRNSIQNIKYRYKEAEGSWGSYTNATNISTSGGYYTCNDIVLMLDHTKSFIVEVVVTDLFETVTTTVTIDPGEAVFFIGTNTKKLYYNGVEMLEYDVIDEW